MKKTALILAVLMVVSVFAGCSVKTTDTQTGSESGSAQNTQTGSESSSAQDTQTGSESDSAQDKKYAFEFNDVDGNTHKLSDYEGKPVYLLVWGSWCSVCMSELEAMNEFAAVPEDYYVLSVVFPNHAGEKSEEDFIEWYKDLGYENLTVMFDNDLQIVRDFEIGGFPSNIFFDAQGNFAGGQVGGMSPDLIDQVMLSLVEE